MSSARDELSKLYALAGRLTPETVLAAATRDDSPLHRYFTWDDNRVEMGEP